MSEMDTLQAIVDKLLSICEKEGIEQSEVYIERKTAVNISQSPYQKAQPIETSAGSTTGLALRILLKDNLQGITYSSDIEEENVPELVLGVKKSVLPVEGFDGFISNCQPTQVEDTYDQKIAETITNSKALFTLIKESKETIADFPDMKLQYANLTAVTMDKIIANSNGLNQTSQGTFLSIGVQTALAGQEELTGTYRHQVQRKFAEKAIIKLTQAAAKESQIMSKAITFENKDYPAIITARAASDLYGYQFEPNICLSGVRSGTSKLGDKIGAQVASEQFTLYDDATLSGGQYTTPFDDEGTPTEKTIVIDNGLLKGFLSNSIHAKRNNSKTTGNCIRIADRRINNYYTRAYNYRPLTYTTNLCVAPGDSSQEEILQELNEGILINDFSGGISVTDPSGDFNIPAAHLYKIEKGEIQGAVKQATVAGNWFELFKNILLIGKKREREMSSLGATSYVWPWLLISDLSFKIM